jgi:protease YdgD
MQLRQYRAKAMTVKTSLPVLPVLAVLAALAALALPARASDKPPSFSPALDAVCGLGAAQSAGCDAIRARAVVDPTARPYSAVARLNQAGRDIKTHCTAALVSQRLALTAAHCLFDSRRQRWIPLSSLVLLTGYERGHHQLSSQIERTVLAPAIDPGAPGFAVAPGDDWALLVLTEPLGATAGFFPLFQGRLRTAGPGEATLVGYAGLRPHVLTEARDCGRPLVAGGRLMAGCAAMPGDSGAPLLWQGVDGLALLGTTTAVSGETAPFSTHFAPWFRLRDAIATEIANGN